MDCRYRDREDAGRKLAPLLDSYREANPQVYGLLRGGLVVAAPVAKDLGVPLQGMVVRKIGHPRHRELGIGAMAPDGGVWLNEASLVRFDVDRRELDAVIEEEREETRRRLAIYGIPERGDGAGRTVIVVDDGLATGVTARVAGEFLRRAEVSRLVLAVPVAPPETVDRMRETFDEVVCPCQPSDLRSVGEWYEEFTQTEDKEVMRLLHP